ncbi:MAG: bifunctional diaminohydroxyphosphoribosylaminopyrimidine deaminase/5-amino-6-(5-phosphoribosylamino)uracil reductase RibD, partial [bacterium]
DPNPRVNGAGIAALRSAGVEVAVGVGASAARALNRGFCQRMSDGRPWVQLKMAASADGKTALASGESQWITSAAARRDAHRLRAASSAILTGVGTVLRDDPRMTARLDGVARQPLRVILDSHLSTPPRSRILQPPGDALIITAAANAADAAALRSGSVEVIAGTERDGAIDLREVMAELAAREINELMLEAGPRLSGAMLQQRLVDEIVIYLAPDLLGSNANGMFDLPELACMDDKHRFAFGDIRRIGRDLRLTLHRADDADDGADDQRDAQRS